MSESNPGRDVLRRVVAFVNNKGGVGKSSLAVNVAGALAAGGARVLLVGLDPQYDETIFRMLGHADLSDGGKALAAAMVDGSALRIVSEVRPRLDVVADGRFLEHVLTVAYGRVFTSQWTHEDWFNLLRPALAEVAGSYDYVILDCPPSARPLIRAGLGAARYVVIPTSTDAGSVGALAGTAVEFSAARARNTEITLAGIILTRSSLPTTKARAAALEQIEGLFGEQPPMFDTFTRFAEAATARAQAENLLVHELVAVDTKGPWQTNSQPLAEDYIAITRELIQIIDEQENTNA